jgi:hypothetical protein
MVGKRKKMRRGEEPLIVIKLIYYVPNFFINFNKTAMLCRNQHYMSDICRDTVGNRPRGLAGDTLGNAPSGFPLLVGNIPK